MRTSRHLPWAIALAAIAALAGCADAVSNGDDTTSATDTFAADGGDTGTDTGTTAAPLDMAVDTMPPTPMCGNDVREGSETCDGKDVAPATCETNGFSGGTLQCNPSCDGYDTTLCTSSAMCGDGVAEGSEPCDGADFLDATCATEGFAGGRLICLAGCVLDTAQCTSCGDGTRDPSEACDGTDLNGATCATEGFDAGAIACDQSCALDTSACTRESCGNGTNDPGEDCEDGVGSATCRSLGYSGGALSCTNNCSYDTSGCFDCGDGVADNGEVCDGNDLAGETCASQGQTAGSLACAVDCQAFDTSGCSDCGDGTINGAEECEGSDFGGATCESLGFTFGDLACTAGCAFDASGCALNNGVPGAGEIVFTEFMINPEVITDANGEWFEVHNTTAGTLNLLGCHLTDGANESHFVASDVIVQPGGYATLAATDMPGFTPDYVYTYADIKFTNTSDTLQMTCPDGAGGSVLVDAVAWDDGATFPKQAGFSMSLGLDYLDATDNDDGLNWCNSAFDPAGSSYDNNNLGTPGRANYACQIGWCNLQFPDLIGTTDALPIAVFGQVFADGMTNLGNGADPDPRLLGQVGWGPFGGDPMVNPGSFTWTDAVPNTGFSNGNNDEYQADLDGVPTGTWSMFYRFSYDGGSTWQYCDTNGATPQGAPDPVFDPNDAGLIDRP